MELGDARNCLKSLVLGVGEVVEEFLNRSDVVGPVLGVSDWSRQVCGLSYRSAGPIT